LCGDEVFGGETDTLAEWCHQRDGTLAAKGKEAYENAPGRAERCESADEAAIIRATLQVVHCLDRKHDALSTFYLRCGRRGKIVAVRPAEPSNANQASKGCASG
jgi:hypothetical protein